VARSSKLPEVHVLVGNVSGEELVPPLPVEKDLCLALGELHDAVLGIWPRRHHRLVLMPDKQRQVVEEIL
jgi:hypothetical protein